MKKLASLSLRPGPHALPQAMAWLEQAAEQQHWDARTLFKLSLCMDEALTNIVMYAFPMGAFPDPETVPRIDLGISCDGTRIVLDLADNGVAYDPTRSTPGDLAASLDDAVIGGHGLRILQHYLEKMEYQRTDDGCNRLYLTIALSLAGPDA